MPQDETIDQNAARIRAWKKEHVDEGGTTEIVVRYTKRVNAGLLARAKDLRAEVFAALDDLAPLLMEDLGRELEQVCKGAAQLSDMAGREYFDQCTAAQKERVHERFNDLATELINAKERFCGETDFFPRDRQRLLRDLKAKADEVAGTALISFLATQVRRDDPNASPASTGPNGKFKPERATGAIRARRYALITKFCKENSLPTRPDFARRLGMSLTAIRGIVSGDSTRYSDSTKRKFLDFIRVSPDEW
jgi:hypothetical protein